MLMITPIIFLLSILHLLSPVFSAFTVSQVYSMPDKTGCSFKIGDLVIFTCKEGYEMHQLKYLLQLSNSSTYSSSLYINSTNATTNPHSYSLINNKARVSYVRNKVLYVYDINSTTNTIQLSAESFSFPTMADATILTEYLVFRDSNYNYLYYQDRLTDQAIKFFSQNDYVINYDIKVSNSSQYIYDVLVCTDNSPNSDNMCFLQKVNSTYTPSYWSQPLQISLGTICGRALKLSKNYAAIGCPFYQNNQGTVVLYLRSNSSPQLAQLLQVSGDAINSQMGESVDIYEHTDDHVTFFFTARSGSSQTVSSVSTVQVIRYWVPQDNKFYYIKNITINQFRVANSDFTAGSALSIQVYQKRIYMMYSQWSALNKMDICAFIESYNGTSGACTQCQYGYFVTSFNSDTCQSCGNIYPANSFESFIQIKYCPGQTFNSTLVTQTNNSITPADPNSYIIIPGSSTVQTQVPLLAILISIAGVVLIIVVTLVVCLVIRRKEQLKRQKQKELEEQQREQAQLKASKYLVSPNRTQRGQISRDDDYGTAPVDDEAEQRDMPPTAEQNNINHFKKKTIINEPLFSSLESSSYPDIGQTDFQIILSSSIPSESKKQELLDIFQRAIKQPLQDWLKVEPSIINAQQCQLCQKKLKLHEIILKLEPCSIGNHMVHANCLARDFAILKKRNLDCEACAKAATSYDDIHTVEDEDGDTSVFVRRQKTKAIIVKLDDAPVK